MEQSPSQERKPQVLYTALFVQDTAQLLALFPPTLEKVFAHHSTIAFKPANLDGIAMGQASTLRILARVTDEKGDALLVDNPHSANQYPHITLSCAPGVSPVYSNELLSKAASKGRIVYFTEPIEIPVVMGFSDGKRDYTESSPDGDTPTRTL
jgi:Fungal tRNA ligase phosphodiesterase domain